MTGPASFLDGLTSGSLDAGVPEGLVHTLLLDPAGGIRGDIRVARLAGERFLVLGGPLDFDHLVRRAPAGVTVRDVTGGTCGLGIWGPRAPELIASLRSGGYLGMVPVTVLRSADVGEPGWEVYAEAQYGQRLWDTIWEAGRESGLVAAGQLAYESLRIEHGRRVWGVDMTGEDDPYQAGLEAAVRPGARPATLPDRRLSCLRIEDTGEVPVGGEPVYAGGFVVGHVTSAAYGWAAGAPLAFAWLPAALSVPGTQVEIGCFDRRLLAAVAAEPVVEPEQEQRPRR